MTVRPLSIMIRGKVDAVTTPIVSVCISTYNHQRYISRCLESVVAQLPPGKLEILVGDDLSTDETRGIVTTFAQNWGDIIIPIFNEKNLGPSANLSQLIRRARGQFIAHLDGDDYWLPGKLAEQLAFLKVNATAPAVLSNALVISDDGSPIGFFTNYQKERVGLSDLVGNGNFLCHGSLLYRAEYKTRLLEIPMPYIDYMLLIRLAEIGPMGYLHHPFVAYRWNSTTSMRAAMRGLVHENFWHALKFAFGAGVDRVTLRRAVSHFFEQVTVANLIQGKLGAVWSWAQRLRNESPVPVMGAVLCGAMRMPLSLWRYLRKQYGSRKFKNTSVFYRR